MLIAVVFFYLSVAFQFAESGQSESDSQWLQYRRDPALTGHSPLKGKISSPIIKWKYKLSAREGFFILYPDDSLTSETNVPEKQLNPDLCRSIVEAWGMDDPWYQLENGQKVVVPGPEHINIGYFLPAVLGLQQLKFDTGFEARGNNSMPLYGRLLVYQSGQ